MSRSDHPAFGPLLTQEGSREIFLLFWEGDKSGKARKANVFSKQRFNTLKNKLRSRC
jgi:hypothetical protein